LYALSILLGEEYPLQLQQLEALLRIPSDSWTSLGEGCSEALDEALIHEMALKGLLLTDVCAGTLGELNRRDEILSSSEWNVYAALFHFMTKWRGVRAAKLHLPEQPDQWSEIVPSSVDFLRSYVVRFGNPPPEFHHVQNAAQILRL